MFKKIKTNFFAVVLISSVFILPAIVPLESLANFRIVTSIVPCGTSSTGPCQTCHLFELGHNVVDFLMWDIAGPLAGLMFIIGGFFIVTAGDSPQRRQQGLAIFSSTMWGLAIVFLSWILINSIIFILGPNSQGTAGDILRSWSSPPGAFCR